MNNISEVLTVAGVADRYKGGPLGSYSVIWRLVRSGQIPSRRIGKKYLVRTADVEAWLKGETGQQTQQQTTSGIRRIEI